MNLLSKCELVFLRFLQFQPWQIDYFKISFLVLQRFFEKYSTKTYFHAEKSHKLSLNTLILQYDLLIKTFLLIFDFYTFKLYPSEISSQKLKKQVFKPNQYQLLYNKQVLNIPITKALLQKMFQFAFQSASLYPLNIMTKRSNIVVISPSQEQYQKVLSYEKSDQENTTQVNIIHSQPDFEQIKEQNPSAELVQNQIKNYMNSDSVNENRQIRKRKNKEQKSKQISEKHKDDGRGGNCIASNISKTLNRIIESKLQRKVFVQYSTYTQNYNIKSQKENTIILLLILYVLAKQSKVSAETLDQIFKYFILSLEDSERNCENKMKNQQERRGFHCKNKKMYTRFIQINTELYNALRKSLVGINLPEYNLESIQTVISDTYDRKQRQIQKAMNKIKSIILIHADLRQFFGYFEHDVEKIFYQSVQYAYRRNLPKRCNQVKSKAAQIFSYFKNQNLIKNQEDQYLICYVALQLINDKSNQIWQEFITNLTMKNQFNQNSNQRKQFQNLLRAQIPQRFNRQISLKFQQQQNSCKIEEQTDSNCMQNMYTAFEQLKLSLEY